MSSQTSFLASAEFLSLPPNPAAMERIRSNMVCLLSWLQMGHRFPAGNRSPWDQAANDVVLACYLNILPLACG